MTQDHQCSLKLKIQINKKIKFLLLLRKEINQKYLTISNKKTNQNMLMTNLFQLSKCQEHQTKRIEKVVFQELKRMSIMH